MKIVVFGPDKRVGALRGEEIVDLSLAYAKLLKERQGERQPTLLASALVPSDLAMFIEGGARTLEHAEAALDHLFGDTHDLLGANGETLVHKASEVRLHAPASERRAHCVRRGKLCRSSRGNGGHGPVAGCRSHVD